MQLNHRPARRDGTGPFYFAINGARSLASTARYRTARFVLRFSTAAEIVPLPSRSLRCRRLSSLHLSLLGRQSRRRARGRELPEGPWRFEIVCSEILPSLWPTFWSRPERQKACCLRHLSAD